MTIKWKIILHIIVIIGIFLSGFFTGRHTIKEKEITKIEYIKGDTITNIIYEPIPEYIETPIDTINIIKQCIADGIYNELWPEKVVTEYIEITKEDTTKIMKDWATKRTYEETLFQNDSIGYCGINAEVQYNRMRILGFKYEPVIRQITETQYKIKTFSTFVGGGFMTNPWDQERNPIIMMNGGIYIKEKYGLQLNLGHALKSKDDYIGGSIIFKF